MSQWIDNVARSPRTRFAILLVGSITLSVVTAVYANIVTPAPESKMDWRLLYTGGHALALIFALSVWVWLNLALLKADEDVSRFADDQHCRAFVRKARLEAYARSLHMAGTTRAKPAKAVMEELGLKP